MGPTRAEREEADRVAAEIVVRHLWVVKICDLNVYDGEQAEQIAAMLKREMSDHIARALAARRPATPEQIARINDRSTWKTCSCNPLIPHACHSSLTEADVEAALRAVPCFRFTCHLHHKDGWEPDYPAMARAVLTLIGGRA